MFDSISDMMKELPSDMDGVSATPAPLHLFAVDEKAKVVDETTAQFLHHNVAKLLFFANVLILTYRLQLHFYILERSVLMLMITRN